MRARLRKMTGLPWRQSMLLRINPASRKPLKHAKQGDFTVRAHGLFVARCNTPSAG
jgi:hypothetical protein